MKNLAHKELVEKALLTRLVQCMNTTSDERFYKTDLDLGVEPSGDAAVPNEPEA